MPFSEKLHPKFYTSDTECHKYLDFQGRALYYCVYDLQEMSVRLQENDMKSLKIYFKVREHLSLSLFIIFL